MKKLLLFFCFLVFAGIAKAQDVDSSKITQTITLQQQHHLYILGNLGNWGEPSTINYINQIRSQYDTANMQKSITVIVPSFFIRNAYQQLSYQPEGQATQWNEEIDIALMSQLTNPWLGTQVMAIKFQNWAARDAKVQATAERLMLINKVP